MKLDSLKKEITINHFRLKNRVVMPPMVTNAATHEGFVTSKIIDYYKKRAAKIGLVIVESTNVFPGGDIADFQIQIHNDCFIPGLTHLAEAIKSQETPAIIQLNHGGAKALPSKVGTNLVSASEVCVSHGLVPRSLTGTEIHTLVDAFAQGAQRAVQSGFDGVEIQGCHFYLLSQFLSAYTNRRNDKYGGSLPSRARFFCEVIRAVRARIGKGPLISCRINGFESLENGLRIEDAAQIGKMLKKSGADLLHVSGVIHAVDVSYEGKSYTRLVAALMEEDPEGAFVEAAAQIREIAQIPVIVAGKIFSPQLAEAIVREEKADLVAFGGQMLVNEDFGSLLFDDKIERIENCTQCYQCLQCIIQGKPVECSLNTQLFQY